MATSVDLEFVITAPGKIILFGEHSVVYGKKALAGTVGLYTTLHFKENKSGNITVIFPAVDFEETFDVSNVREYFNAGNDGLSRTEKVRLSLENFKSFYTKYGSKTLTDEQRYSLVTLFTCLSYYTGPCTGFTIHVTSDLPVSSGAGSSASFSVTVATALLLLELARKTDDENQYIIRQENTGKVLIGNDLREMILDRAFLCESIFHGTPSGVDHSVIVAGFVVGFVKKSDGNIITHMEGDTIKVLLVNTKVRRSTKKQVEILKIWKEKFPEPVGNILEAMGHITEDAISTLSDMSSDYCNIFMHEDRLSNLVDLNHNLLRSVGVSHHSLETVCNTAKKYGLSAKLTGAGGGGLSFVYLPTQTPSSVVKNLTEELESAGFDVSEVSIGGPGLEIKYLSS